MSRFFHQKSKEKEENVEGFIKIRDFISFGRDYIYTHIEGKQGEFGVVRAPILTVLYSIL